MFDPFEVVTAGEAGWTSNGSPGQIRKEAALRIALRCHGSFVHGWRTFSNRGWHAHQHCRGDRAGEGDAAADEEDCVQSAHERDHCRMLEGRTASDRARAGRA